MCPAAVHFWFNVRARQIDAQSTVGASITFTAPRNAERVGFILSSQGGNINYRPTQFALGTFVQTFTLAGTAPFRPITIFEYGNLIVEPWDFVYVSFPNSYSVWELFTPANFQNEIMVR